MSIAVRHETKGDRKSHGLCQPLAGIYEEVLLLFSYSFLCHHPVGTGALMTGNWRLCRSWGPGGKLQTSTITPEAILFTLTRMLKFVCPYTYIMIGKIHESKSTSANK